MWNANHYQGSLWDAYRLEVPPSVPDKAGCGQWLLNARGAHPFWHQYMAYCVHFRPVEGIAPPVKYRETDTHEFLLFALDPAHEIDGITFRIGIDNFTPLDPPNHGYHFYAATDEHARARCEAMIVACCDGHLNPDTDYRKLWDMMWPDAYSLRKTGPRPTAH